MHWIAERLRRLADRIDYPYAPRATRWSVHFKDGIYRVRDDGVGRRLYSIGGVRYEEILAEEDKLRDR